MRYAAASPFGTDGPRLAGRRDLILMDEASMATTFDVREAVRIAPKRGALVRLIGDQRQAKAVGAGGALEAGVRDLIVIRCDDRQLTTGPLGGR